MEYVTALEIAHKDKASFVEFIADSVVSTQEDLLRLLKNSGGVKSLNGGVNKKARGGVNLQQAPQQPFTLKSLPRLLSFSWCCKWPVLKVANPLQFLVQNQRNRTSLGLGL